MNNQLSTIIRLENITKTYGPGNTLVRALDGINLTVKQGDYCAIMGGFWFGEIYHDEYYWLSRSPDFW